TAGPVSRWRASVENKSSELPAPARQAKCSVSQICRSAWKAATVALAGWASWLALQVSVLRMPLRVSRARRSGWPPSARNSFSAPEGSDELAGQGQVSHGADHGGRQGCRHADR